MVLYYIYTYIYIQLHLLQSRMSVFMTKRKKKLRERDLRRCKGVIFNKTGLEILRYVCCDCITYEEYTTIYIATVGHHNHYHVVDVYNIQQYIDREIFR